MTTTRIPAPQRDRLGAAVSIALALLANEALAQQAAEPATAAKAAEAKPAEAKPKAPVNELETVLVIGTRKSQQSAIDRKKNAATTQDSIVAEDVGAFPDRNIGEAISRIAGVALDRGDFGEGVNVSIRGNGPELTRVEMDGMAVRSGAGTDLLGGGDGRGTEFRELSSDLIKSVDIVKGSTAAMVEGSLGGGIIITTRTGLDFAKPYYSLRAAVTQSDLNKKNTPNYNLVLADKFLDKRLGVLINLNKSRLQNEQHGITQGGSNGQQGLVRLADFDNSPEKTFTYNPATVNGPEMNTPNFAAPLTAGGFFNSATPLELITRAATAQTKADCFTLFPTLTTAQTNAIASASRTNAYGQRLNEQITCLNQWNDYSPSNTAGFRYNFKSQDDKREGGDIRLDFKVNSNLTVYGKLSLSKRKVEDIVGFLGVGSAVQVNQTTPAVAAPTFLDNTTTNVRTLNPATSAYASLLPNSYSFRANNAPLVLGTTTNILPGYTVDSNHHVTSYSTNNGVLGTDTIFSTIDTDNKTLVGGGEYKDGRLSVQGMAGYTKSTAMRYDRRASFGYTYGIGNYKIDPSNGLWSFSLPNGFDQLNYPLYAQTTPGAAVALNPVSALNPVQTPAYATAQRGLYTNNTLLQVIRSFDTESSEKTAKVDVAYDVTDKIPLLTSVKGGFNFRNTGGKTWTGAGGTISDAVGTFGQAGYIPAVYMPQVNTRWNVVGCENTPGSLVVGGATPGQPCAYGYIPNNQANTATGGVPAGTTTLTQAQYQELIRQTMSLAPSGQFYGGSKNRPANLIDGWNQIDIDKLFQLAGIPVRLDCFRSCTASDGKVYDMPVTSFSEKSKAGYLMSDFEVPLWGNAELTGNFGVRVVQTEVSGTGFITFRSVRKNHPQYETDPTAANATTTYSVVQAASIADKSTDVMPSLNLAFWPIADKLAARYSIGKTIARPPVSKLLASGGTNVICAFSEVIEDSGDEADGSVADQRCTGTMGNPALKPQTNVNQNLSLEWYANRDTSLSLSFFRQRGLIGAPTIGVFRNNTKVFQNSGAVDPQTGTALRDIEFGFSQWDNAAPSTRRGIEFGLKTAFTFLPSVLRYTGVDANYSRVRSSQGAPVLDLISGAVMPVANEPKYSWNASLWYDDGAFQARVAMQVVAPRYFLYSPNTSNNVNVFNYPSVGTAYRTGVTSYNPGAPIWGNRTAYVDAKMSYRFKNGLELFADVRNLTGERTQSTTGGYQDYADGVPNIYTDGYSGRRYMVGFTLRSPR